MTGYRLVMSIAQIEAELERLSADELRQLAVRSWAAFVEKEGVEPAVNECEESDPELLAALDEAVRRADGAQARSFDADKVRSRIGRWITTR